ncbi:MAG: ABC transporter ATP-binding protein [Luteibacter sp.]|uniref:ABC transporter ATP-binding protein n=1 Tax=Luteibacter sp. TaxID=1886636 RepID=UPI0028079749|nr:ABC transporter ATP-binding protein [Luteibacter sp.]MDQ7996429.1 ABC transporter ATP-binding protein [Luteibacter sp.]MDQ8047943.1 ABC transporter ATP-binding protein [Luteibacter sp.]
MSSEAMSAPSMTGGGTETVIAVSGVGKCYQIYAKPIHRLLQGIVGSRKKYFREFWALRGVNFSIQRGQTLGIIGRNGSGKSTLLQMIAGTLATTEGTIEVQGRVAALLELGSGFNPEFSGRENVYMNAAILGLTRAEIDARYEDILAFADIGDFVEQPVKNYSSGMVMRLAFSVMVHVDADILIIDEALAVGDAFFTQKCMRYLREFKKRGTLLFVSHDGAAITGLCDKAIWIDQGHLRASGDAKDVMGLYMEEFMAKRGSSSTPDAELSLGHRRHDPRRELIDRSTLRNDIEVLRFDPVDPGAGTLNARIVDVAMLNEAGEPISWIIGGECVTLEISVLSQVDLSSVIVGFYLKDRLGQYLFGDNTFLTYQDAPFALPAGEVARARFTFDMPRLQHGDYFITAGIAEGTQEEHELQNWLHEALLFKSVASNDPVGIIGLPMLDIKLKKD